jgi:hypothetical protein
MAKKAAKKAAPKKIAPKKVAKGAAGAVKGGKAGAIYVKYG